MTLDIQKLKEYMAEADEGRDVWRFTSELEDVAPQLIAAAETLEKVREWASITSWRLDKWQIGYQKARERVLAILDASNSSRESAE